MVEKFSQPARKEMDGLENWGYTRLTRLYHALSLLSGRNRAIWRNAPILFFLFFWILPVLYFGLFDVSPPGLPEFLRRRTNVSRLFANDYSSIAIYELQFRRRGTGFYEIFPEEEYFKMHPFGYRTRMQRGLAMADQPRREALVGWSKEQIENHLGPGTIAAFRIVVVPYKIGSCPGRYRQPRSSEMNADAVTVVAEYQF